MERPLSLTLQETWRLFAFSAASCAPDDEARVHQCSAVSPPYTTSGSETPYRTAWAVRFKWFSASMPAALNVQPKERPAYLPGMKPLYPLIVPVPFTAVRVDGPNPTW